jgi:hypothetical protein
MIEIIKFNRTIFENFSIDEKKLTRYIYINNLDLIAKLLTIELPIANTKLALRNILDFLTYVDNKISEKSSTIIPISSEILISYFSRDKYKKYMNILNELNVITKVPYEDGTFYKPKSLYLQYRTHNEYLNDEDLAIIILEDDRTKETFSNEVEDLDNRYINTIKKLEINIPAAIDAEIKNFFDKGLSINSLRTRISRIFYTKRKRFIKKGIKVDRIYHSFTNLSRVSRKHFNTPMNDIDIVNCQPLLLVALLNRNGFISDKGYQLDCESGCFYERFIDINKPIDISDDEWRIITKQKLYKSVFFGFDTRGKYNKRFKELYPNTWSSLEIISKNCTSLASQLQNLESELFNNIIPKKSKYYFTLFDAIYFDNILDRYELEKTIKNYFKSFNINVSIK